jgi:dTDP-4-dehydrorhamnose reductase
MGGPDRLSRADMADAVAAACGHDARLIVRAPAASVDRGAPSPADISMDSARLEAAVGMALTPFKVRAELLRVRSLHVLCA